MLKIEEFDRLGRAIFGYGEILCGQPFDSLAALIGHSNGFDYELCIAREVGGRGVRLNARLNARLSVLLRVRLGLLRGCEQTYEKDGDQSHDI
jgi:hypothetical protein